MKTSPFREGQAPILSDAWNTEGSSRDQPAMWPAVAVEPETDTTWFDTRIGQSSQWVELRAMWPVATNESPP